MLKDRKENAPRSPADTMCASWKSWKVIKAEKVQPPIDQNQHMRKRHRKKKQDKKRHHHHAAKFMAQQVLRLALLEYTFYNAQASAVKKETKRAIEEEALGR